jgi:hypothetical protein
LDFLLNPENQKKELWTLHGYTTNVPFYKFENYRIWGATAMITAEFLEIYKEVIIQ